MMARDVADFLAATPWANASATPLTGDASARRYLRLDGGPGPALVMIAPPETCGPLDPFVSLTKYLHGVDLRAPEIFAEDRSSGLLLLEDFGDALLALRAQEAPSEEPALYTRATDVLIALHKQAPPKLTVVGPDALADMLEPLFTHYAPCFKDGVDVIREMRTQLNALPEWTPSLALRDYHAENLIILNDAEDPQSLGLLDYQDAILTHPAYDLASLLQDARRMVPLAIETAMIARFQDRTGLTQPSFRSGYRLIALQRNLRILGIFARLAAERPGARYTQFQPIVWRHVQRMLETPEGRPLKPLLAGLPAPEHC